jgi:acyl transferase domain-containing protein
MSPQEAAMCDPQQRLLLEAAAQLRWRRPDLMGRRRAGEVAQGGEGGGGGGGGQGAAAASSTSASSPSGCAVFVGISIPDYASLAEAHTPIGAYSATGSALSTAAGRVSFAFDLTGACVSVGVLEQRDRRAPGRPRRRRRRRVVLGAPAPAGERGVCRRAR